MLFIELPHPRQRLAIDVDPVAARKNRTHPSVGGGGRGVVPSDHLTERASGEPLELGQGLVELLTELDEPAVKALPLHDGCDGRLHGQAPLDDPSRIAM